ncbi:hypothetical protein BV737P3_00033 [Phocaeicola phage BV737P3]|nr:hypothetical protein BV737P3_00033 [Phocaeicola phage BV737P3]
MKKNLILIVIVWITLLLTFSFTACSESPNGADLQEGIEKPLEESKTTVIELSEPIKMWLLYETDFWTGKDYKIGGEEFDGTYLIKVSKDGAQMIGSKDETVKPLVDVNKFMGAKSAYRLNNYLTLLLRDKTVVIYFGQKTPNGDTTVPYAEHFLEFKTN